MNFCGRGCNAPLALTKSRNQRDGSQCRAFRKGRTQGQPSQRKAPWAFIKRWEPVGAGAKGSPRGWNSQGRKKNSLSLSFSLSLSLSLSIPLKQHFRISGYRRKKLKTRSNKLSSSWTSTATTSSSQSGKKKDSLPHAQHVRTFCWAFICGCLHARLSRGNHNATGIRRNADAQCTVAVSSKPAL